MTWVRAHPWLALLLLATPIAAMGVLVWLGPLVFTTTPRGIDPADRSAAVTGTRTVMVALLAVAVAAVGGTFAGLSYRNAAETLRITERRNLDDRFAKAVELLAQDETSLRLAAVFTLDQLAQDSEPHRGPIVRVLANYAREESVRVTRRVPGIIGLDTEYGPYGTVVAAVETIGRVGAEGFELDLSGVTAPGANLNDAKFVGLNMRDANFTGSRLENALFERTALDGAVFNDTTLAGATFLRSSVARASFVTVILDGARLEDFNVDGAMFADVIYDGETVGSGGYFVHNRPDLKDASAQQFGMLHLPPQ